MEEEDLYGVSDREDGDQKPLHVCLSGSGTEEGGRKEGSEDQGQGKHEQCDKLGKGDEKKSRCESQGSENDMEGTLLKMGEAKVSRVTGPDTDSAEGAGNHEDTRHQGDPRLQREIGCPNSEDFNSSQRPCHTGSSGSPGTSVQQDEFKDSGVHGPEVSIKSTSSKVGNLVETSQSEHRPSSLATYARSYISSEELAHPSSTVDNETCSRDGTEQPPRSLPAFTGDSSDEMNSKPPKKDEEGENRVLSSKAIRKEDYGNAETMHRNLGLGGRTPSEDLSEPLLFPMPRSEYTTTKDNDLENERYTTPKVINNNIVPLEETAKPSRSPQTDQQPWTTNPDFQQHPTMRNDEVLLAGLLAKDTKSNDIMSPVLPFQPLQVRVNLARQVPWTPTYTPQPLHTLELHQRITAETKLLHDLRIFLSFIFSQIPPTPPHVKNVLFILEERGFDHDGELYTNLIEAVEHDVQHYDADNGVALGDFVRNALGVVERGDEARDGDVVVAGMVLGSAVGILRVEGYIGGLSGRDWTEGVDAYFETLRRDEGGEGEVADGNKEGQEGGDTKQVSTDRESLVNTLVQQLIYVVTFVFPSHKQVSLTPNSIRDILKILEGWDAGSLERITRVSLDDVEEWLGNITDSREMGEAVRIGLEVLQKGESAENLTLKAAAEILMETIRNYNQMEEDQRLRDGEGRNEGVNREERQSADRETPFKTLTGGLISILRWLFNENDCEVPESVQTVLKILGNDGESQEQITLKMICKVIDDMIHIGVDENTQVAIQNGLGQLWEGGPIGHQRVREAGEALGRALERSRGHNGDTWRQVSLGDLTVATEHPEENGEDQVSELKWRGQARDAVSGGSRERTSEDNTVQTPSQLSTNGHPQIQTQAPLTRTNERRVLENRVVKALIDIHTSIYGHLGRDLFPKPVRYAMDILRTEGFRGTIDNIPGLNQSSRQFHVDPQFQENIVRGFQLVNRGESASDSDLAMVAGLLENGIRLIGERGDRGRGGALRNGTSMPATNGDLR